MDDIARVYKVPKWAIDNIKTSLSKGRMDTQGTTKRSWIRSIHIQMLKTGRTISLHWNMHPVLEGNIRNFGVHAAGLVISSVPINDICATYSRDGKTAIAYNKYDAVYMNL